MSVADLKARLADVPGIETLSMRLEAGRILLWWGNWSAAVEAAASDGDIETAIRNAIRLPPVTLIPDKPIPAPVPEASKVQPMSETNPASVGQTVQTMMGEHVKLMGEIHAAQLEILKSTLANQRQSVSTAIGSVASKIAEQTDEFNAIMGQFSNSLGAENL